MGRRARRDPDTAPSPPADAGARETWSGGESVRRIPPGRCLGDSGGGDASRARPSDSVAPLGGGGGVRCWRTGLLPGRPRAAPAGPPRDLSPADGGSGRFGSSPVSAGDAAGPPRARLHCERLRQLPQLRAPRTRHATCAVGTGGMCRGSSARAPQRQDAGAHGRGPGPGAPRAARPRARPVAGRAALSPDVRLPGGLLPKATRGSPGCCERNRRNPAGPRPSRGRGQGAGRARTWPLEGDQSLEDAATTFGGPRKEGPTNPRL